MVLGNSFSPMMIHDASLRYQNSISNPHESFVDDFDDLDVTFNQHVYTPKALNSDNEGHFPNKEKVFKVSKILKRFSVLNPLALKATIARCE